MKKKLYQFLKEEGCLLEYLLNCSVHNPHRWNGNNNITGDFSWCATTEGYDFWFNTYNKWTNYRVNN